MYSCFLLLVLWVIVAFPQLHPTRSQKCAYIGLHVRRVITHDDHLQVRACFRPLYMFGMEFLNVSTLIKGIPQCNDEYYNCL